MNYPIIKTTAAILLATVASGAMATAQEAPTITMEQIMANPDWIQRRAESWYWGDKSEAIYYNQKREGSPLRDLYRQGLNGTAEKVDLDSMQWHSDRGAVRNNDKTMEAYAFEGNIFLKNVGTGAVRQITHTTARESAPQFLNDGRVAYRVGNVFYGFNSTNGETREIVNLMAKDKPKGAQDPTTYLAKEEHKLIDFVADGLKNKKAREGQHKKLQQANATVIADPFYFGKGNRITAASLSPDGTRLIVGVRKATPSRDKNDIMPNYITSDAMIDPVRVRGKVADSKPNPTTLFLVNLKDHSQTALSYKTLPGHDEDVLKKVKAENYKAQGKKYKSKKAERPINLLFGSRGIQWHSSGEEAAVMVRAWDNKDLWIATVDFEDKKLVSQDRQHDDAWINSRMLFNYFWAKDSKTLLFVSEKSGYAQLYAKTIGKKTRALTKGDYVVSSLTYSNDGKSVFYKANKKHPGIYEVYKVDVDSGVSTTLTNLGGMNNYALSPDNKKLLIEHSTTTMPPELYSMDIGSPAKRLTHTVTDKFLSMKFTAPEMIAIKSDHGTNPIYSKFYKPSGEAQGKRKAVMFTHGAGYLQNSHQGWSGYFREHMFNTMLAQKGYFVMEMDWRASAGYGRDWRTAIYRQFGIPELEDMRTGVNWMVKNHNVDAKRIGTYGGSYGGFLTLMALFKEPDLFAAGSAQRLVSDWAHYNHGYTSNIINKPTDDPIAYKISSPIYYAEGLKGKLLMNHGMVDNNVFYQDTVRLVQRLIELEKVDWESAIYPVEPHGFRTPSSWLNEYRRVFKLFDGM